MATMKILRGIPASGKSTYAREWVAEYPDDRVRVNRDDIRLTMFGKRWGVDETMVTRIQNAMIEAALSTGKDVVVDNTNLRARNVKELLRLAAKHGATVEYRDFLVGEEEAVARDKTREDAVGEEVIRTFYRRFMRNGYLPAFPVLEERPILPFKKYEHTDGLPWAIIVDIDGTLAHMDGRGPYDTSRYHEDTFDGRIATLVEGYRDRATVRVIVMSGRDEAFKGVTEEWLRGYGFTYHEIYMRPEGDIRNDAIVKDELFEKHVAGRYNIDFILDDRDRVVKMWRAKGLRCYQVADGNF